MPRGRLAVNVVQGALRRKEILELRTKGYSTAAIAERLSCGKTTVKRHLHAALEDLAAENLEFPRLKRRGPIEAEVGQMLSVSYRTFPRLKRRGPIEAPPSSPRKNLPCFISTSEKTWPH